MILFPAIDIQNGKAVRLAQGQKDKATVFADDPVEMARHWRKQGANWLHIVDLDGAFEGYAKNAPIVERICSEINIPVQIGGGIRDLETARTYFAAGAKRIIIGTMALENPELFGKLCAEFPGQVGISLDAVGGKLKSRGWEKDAGKNIDEVLPDLEKLGAAFVIYTDIERDGMRTGVNVAALEKLVRLSGIPVICAGGVSVLYDLVMLHDKFAGTRLEGAISGRALYEGSLDFSAAQQLLENIR